MTLKERLKDWTEQEIAIIEIGKCLGIYNEHLGLHDIPKYVLWSASEDSKDTEMTGWVLHRLYEMGVLEERDGKYDLEFRWSPDYEHKWHTISSGKNPPGTLPVTFIKP